jgi:hypothetical protein
MYSNPKPTTWWGKAKFLSEHVVGHTSRFFYDIDIVNQLMHLIEPTNKNLLKL